MDNTNKEIVCLELDSELTDLSGRSWNYRNNGGITFHETGGVFDKPYIQFTDSTSYKNYLYTRNVTPESELSLNEDEFTIEFYIRNIIPSTSTSQWFLSFQADDNTNITSGWSIVYNKDTKKMSFYENSVTSTNRPSFDASDLRQWTHIAYVMKNNMIYVYMDGTKVDSKPTPLSYRIKTGIKDGLYINRHNFVWNTVATDSALKCDFGGLKISNYARYDVSQDMIIPRVFSIDNGITYNSYNKTERIDKLIYFYEMYGNGARWINNRNEHNYSMNDSSFNPYLVYDNLIDESVIKTSIKGGHVAFRPSVLGSTVNNIEQDWTIFWDYYFTESWCSYTTQKSVKINMLWSSTLGTNGEEVIMWYGRDTNGRESSFVTTVGSLSSYTTEPAEQYRKYLGYKFEPNICYKMAVSYKNHKLYHYINGVQVAVVDHSNLNNVAFSQHYSTLNNYSLGGATVASEINCCEKLDNVFFLTGVGFDTETYDPYEYDYDGLKRDALSYYYENAVNKPRLVKPSTDTLLQKYELWTDAIDGFGREYTNTLPNYSMDGGYIETPKSYDARQLVNYKFILDGYSDKEKINIRVLDRHLLHLGRLNENGKVEYNLNLLGLRDDYINLIDGEKFTRVYAENSKYAKGYISGRVSLGGCSGNSLFIKLYDSKTYEFIKEYEVDISGNYFIPNLNYYKRYDVVLCDRNSLIESKVSSNRQPKLYNENDIKFDIISNAYYGHTLNLDSIYVFNAFANKVYDFTNMNNVLDSDFTLTRTTVATYFDQNGNMADASINEPRFDWADLSKDGTGGTYQCKGLLVEVESTNLVDNYVPQINLWSSSGQVTLNPSNGKIFCDMPNYPLEYVELLPSGSQKNMGSGIVTQSVRFSKEANSHLRGNFSFYSNVHNQVSGHYYSNTMYSNSINTSSTAYRQVDFTNLKYDKSKAFHVLGLQWEKLPYATSMIRSVNNTNNNRTADVFNFKTTEKVTGTFLYKYINQSNPTEYVYEFMDYIDEVPKAKPNGFVSGWICSILHFDKIIKNEAERADVLYYYFGVDGYEYTKGVWIGNIVTWGTSTLSQWNNKVNDGSNEWYSNFGNTSDFMIYNYKYQSVGDVNFTHDGGVINKSPIGKTFKLVCQNGTWTNTTADLSMEFLDDFDNVIAVLKVERDGYYRNGIWYGNSWGSLTRSGSSGSYPTTNGELTFYEDKIVYINKSGSSNGWNTDFTYTNVNLYKVTKIRVTKLYCWQDYTGGTGTSAMAYLKEI